MTYCPVGGGRGQNPEGSLGRPICVICPSHGLQGQLNAVLL